MSPEQITQWAKECELSRYVQVEKTVVVNVLAAFAALVAAHEREQCARVCDNADIAILTDINGRRYLDGIGTAFNCANAIRARTK